MFILYYIVSLVVVNALIYMIMKTVNKNRDHVYIEAFCIYNDRVYWLKEDELFSSDYSNKEIDILAGKPVDQMSDLMPVEAIAIIDHLQERTRK